MYEDISGREVRDAHYWEVFGAMRFAAIMIPLADRMVDAGLVPVELNMAGRQRGHRRRRHACSASRTPHRPPSDPHPTSLPSHHRSGREGGRDGWVQGVTRTLRSVVAPAFRAAKAGPIWSSPTRRVTNPSTRSSPSPRSRAVRSNSARV